jgi:ATP-dependent RNA helicase RhlB
MMFTATLSYRVKTLGWRQMNDPAEIIINPEQLTPETIQQELYHVSSREKLSLLLGLLKREGASRTMIFANTRHGAKRLVDELRRHGYVCRALTGNVIQTKRLRVLDDFREGRLPILVATDVASRGLHIEGVSHVVNYDLPQDPEDYVHRIGRTARVGATGKAIALACDDWVYSLDAIQDYVGYDIPTVFADDSLFGEVLPLEERRARRDGRSSSRREKRPGGDDSAASARPTGDRKRRTRRRRKRRPSKSSSGSANGGND